jgi:hypothetical protein
MERLYGREGQLFSASTSLFAILRIFDHDSAD